MGWRLEQGEILELEKAADKVPTPLGGELLGVLGVAQLWEGTMKGTVPHSAGVEHSGTTGAYAAGRRGGR